MNLQQSLLRKTKEDLKHLAKFYDLKGAYKFRKQELSQVLAIQIQEQFTFALAMTDKETIKIFEQVLKKKKVSADKMNFEKVMKCLMLTKLSVMGVDLDEKFFYVYPEIIQAYEEKCDNLEVRRALKEKQQYYSKLRDYKDACMNLYGVIKIADFIKLYEEYEGEMDVPSFFKWLEKDRSLYDNYYYEDGYLMNESFYSVSDEEVKYFLSESEKIPYYRPNKIEFLRYMNPYYYEETPEVRALRMYLNKKYPSYREVVEEIILEIMLLHRYAIYPDLGFMEEVLMCFEEVGIEFECLEDVKMLADKVIPVLNQTRIWINRGNSPNDLRKEGEPKFQGTKIIGQEKVGRNALCPCGSGKKYKKCCGK